MFGIIQEHARALLVAVTLVTEDCVDQSTGGLLITASLMGIGRVDTGTHRVASTGEARFLGHGCRRTTSLVGVANIAAGSHAGHSGVHALSLVAGFG